MLKYLWIEPKIEDGVDADGRLGKHRGQGQQVVGHLGVCFEPWMLYKIFSYWDANIIDSYDSAQLK